MPDTPSPPAATLLAKIDRLGLRQDVLELGPEVWAAPDTSGTLHVRRCEIPAPDLGESRSVPLLTYLEGPNAQCCAAKLGGDARRESQNFWELLDVHDLLTAHARDLRDGALDPGTSATDREELLHRVVTFRRAVNGEPRVVEHLDRVLGDLREAVAVAMGAAGPTDALEAAQAVIVPDAALRPFLDWDSTTTLIGFTDDDVREPLPAIISDIFAAQGLREGGGVYVVRTAAYVASYLLRVLPDQSVVMSTPAVDLEQDTLAATLWDPRHAAPLANLATAQASAVAILAR